MPAKPSADKKPEQPVVYPAWWKRPSGGIATGFINERGEIVFESEFALCDRFRDGRAYCVKGGIVTYLDRKFRPAFQINNGRGYEFGHGYARVTSNLSEHQAVMGLVDIAGNLVVDFQFEDVGPIVDNCFYGQPAKDNPHQAVHLYDAESRVLARHVGVSASGHVASEGLVVSLGTGASWGYRDTTGAWAIPARFDDPHDFHDGLAAVALREKKHFRWFFIDRHGETVLADPSWRCVHVDFHDGVAAVGRNLKGNRYGVAFIKRSGESLTEYEYFNVGPFEGGLAPVANQRNKWGYLDLSGKNALPFAYDQACPFEGSLALVQLKKRYHYISRHGDIVFSLPEYYLGEYHLRISRP